MFYKLLIWAGIIATVALIIADIVFEQDVPAEGMGLLTVALVLWHHHRVDHRQ